MNDYIEITGHSERIENPETIIVINYLYSGSRPSEKAEIKFTVTPRKKCYFKNKEDVIEVPVVLTYAEVEGTIELFIPRNFRATNALVTAELIVNKSTVDEHKNYNISVR